MSPCAMLSVLSVVFARSTPASTMASHGAREIQLSVVEEFELKPKAAAVCDGFLGTEYRTDAERAALMGPMLAAAAGVVQQKK